MKVCQLILICVGLSFITSPAQVSFTLPANICLNNTLAISANSGTLNNPQFTWLSTPNAIFGNSVAANTSVSFTAVGNHTVLLVAISGTAMAFMQNTINVIANPSPWLSASSLSVCPFSSFSLTAMLISGATYTFSLPGPVAVNTGSSNILQVYQPIILPAVYEVSVELGGCIGTNSIQISQLQLHPQISTNLPNVCAGFNTTLTAYSGGLTTFTFSALNPSPTLLYSGLNHSIVASPSVPTVYQVLADSLSCTGSSSISIGILPPLNINVSASSPTTCITNNLPKFSKLITLLASGASNYVWLPYDPFNPCIGNCPSRSVRPQATTCYTVTGSTSVCSGSAVICITVTPQFTVAISPASASICVGETLTLVSASIGAGAIGLPSAFSYSWTENINAPPLSMSSYLTPTTQVFPQNPTTYTLEVSDTQSCVSQPQVATVQVFPCLSLPEEELSVNQISIVPNPVHDIGIIESSIATFSKLLVFDCNARLIKTFHSLDGTPVEALNIDLTELPPGVYYLKTNLLHSEHLIYKLVKW